MQYSLPPPKEKNESIWQSLFVEVNFFEIDVSQTPNLHLNFLKTRIEFVHESFVTLRERLSL